ncbi:MAG: 4Fe-4S dicluster domain-containing protein [Planctomycetota bacterium]
MSTNKYEVRILARYCKGCGLCIDECSLDKLFIPSDPNEKGGRIVEVRDEPDCSGCLKCATICPDGAVEVYELVGAEEADAQEE